ncbi:MAG TPA: carboxypeptidase-like regulatory domain-containing protein, partial [Acidobacteriaceae bacterium]|nr:carboxypeptidase-like regulatory domain-containing protein [Acidobacteriaceae bacterium]
MLRPAGRVLLTVLALAGLLLAPALRAQTTAQLSGTVEDASGGVIPGAQVTLVNQATNDTRVSVTNSVGLYSFVALPPSSYSVKVDAKGFQPKQLTDIVLHASDHITVPTFVLAVGSTTQTVQVQAAPQIIPVNNGERSAVLDAKQIQNLALQGRDVTELLKVLPGATTQSGGLTNAAPMFSDLNVSAN